LPIYSNDPEHAEFGVEDSHRKKVYVGILSILDIIILYVEKTLMNGDNPSKVLSYPLSKALGLSTEGARIWVAGSDSTIGDAMETLSKGVHRLLVPVEVEGGDEWEYHVCSQLDLVKYLYKRFDKDPYLQEKAEKTLIDLSIVFPNDEDAGVPAENASMVISVEPSMKSSDALRFMASNNLHAVAVIPATSSRSKPYILATLSLSDLRSLSLQILASDPTVESLLCKIHQVDSINQLKPKNVTVRLNSTLRETVEAMIHGAIHRVWVVDGDGAVKDVVSMTTVLRCLLTK
ncbi:hypothetical protein HDU99_008449, partial [Rhizoclosmatium hyalinum]